MKNKKTLYSVFAALVLGIGAIALTFGSAAAHGYGEGSGGWGGGMMGGHGGWGMFLIGPLMMILVLGVIIGGIFLLVRAFSGGGAAGVPQKDGASEILRKRFATGEISKEEYEERLKILGG